MTTIACITKGGNIAFDWSMTLTKDCFSTKNLCILDQEWCKVHSGVWNCSCNVINTCANQINNTKHTKETIVACDILSDRVDSWLRIINTIVVGCDNRSTIVSFSSVNIFFKKARTILLICLFWSECRLNAHPNSYACSLLFFVLLLFFYRK